jgi:ribosomal-protein-alanine N-acetyltransferase
VNLASDSLCLQGERVLLRPLCLDDADPMFAYARDPEVTRFLPWEPAPDVSSVRPFLAEQVAKRQRGASLALAVVLRETGQVIGSTDLMDLPGSGAWGWWRPRQAELGYLLARPYWGRGLMTEAAALTVCYGFEALGLSRITAWADAENRGSRRVLEKIGMRVRGSETRTVKVEKRLYIRYEISRGRTRGK